MAVITISGGYPLNYPCFCVQFYGSTTDSIVTNSSILYAQQIRNRLAHGDILDDPLSPEDALKYLEIALSTIQALVESLCNKRKALRVCVNINASFDTALALWLLDHYCWGVVDSSYCPADKPINAWYSFTIGLGGKYDSSSDGSASQVLLRDLEKWEQVQLSSDKRKLNFLVGFTKLKPGEELDPESNNIHSLIKWIKQRLPNQESQYREILRWIDLIHKEEVQLDNPQEVAELRRRVCLEIRSTL